MQAIAPFDAIDDPHSTGNATDCNRFMQNIFNCCIRFLINGYVLISTPFKDFFASVQRASKRENNNRTPGEGTCFDIGNIFRSFIQFSKTILSLIYR